MSKTDSELKVLRTIHVLYNFITKYTCVIVIIKYMLLVKVGKYFSPYVNVCLKLNKQIFHQGVA